MGTSRLDRIFAKAKSTVAQNEKVQSLLSEVRAKVDKINTDSTERSTFLYQVQVLVRMIRAHFRGTYTAFSTSTILTLVFGLVYFITPVDLIPDFIPVLGLTDDVSLIYFIFRSLAEDIERFKAWEKAP